MNEFATRWSKLGKRDRKNVRRNMEAKAIESFSVRMKARCTSAQLSAGAKKKVDIAISMARAA